MRSLVTKSVIVLALILMAVALVFPPEERLRKGRDLEGGVNLVYQVFVSGDVQSRQAVMDKVREVIRERLDPKGLLDITVNQQGADRIEISMPLPRPEMRQLSDELETELQKLGATAIDGPAFDRIMRAPAGERGELFAKYTGKEGRRWEAVQKAIAAEERLEAAKAPYEQAVKELREAEAKLKEADPAVIGDAFYELLKQASVAASVKAALLADPVLDAENELRAARDAVTSSGVSTAEIRRILKLRNEPIYVTDPKRSSAPRAELPSRRAEALAKLETSHPGSAEQIERVVAASDAVEKNRKTLNDPSDLVRLLQGAGVLNFRIAVSPGELSQEQELREQLKKLGPQGIKSDQARWYKINKIENWFDSVEEVDLLKASPSMFFARKKLVGEELDGEYYVLLWDTRDKRLTERDGRRWSVRQVTQGTDKLGLPAIDFQMDSEGGLLLGELTGQNLGRQMAVVLDDEVYTAPTLEGRITTQGTIHGSFSKAEVDYVIKVLSHGSFAGKLSKEPISVQIVAAEAGADNLRKGLIAGAVAFVVCSGSMSVDYFGCGGGSVRARMLNALFSLAAMAFLDSPFTLPGIAGVVLVFGQAIDANVLIYERMREEIHRGNDFRTSIRLGYDKALSSIVDGNITTLIVCVVLGLFGTQEIKGFAITLGLGNAMTLFTQLYVTRIVFGWLAEEKRIWKKASMLPLAVPAIERAFDLKVDWMRYRFFFLSISIILTVGGVGFLIAQGNEMLGSEFRGGTKVSIQLASDGGGGRIKKSRAEIKQLIDDTAAKSTDEGVKAIRTADVVLLNPDPKNPSVSSEFTIKTVDTRAKEIQAAVVTALSSVIDAQPALKFTGSQEDAALSPNFPVTDPILGKDIGNQDVKDAVPEFLGGVVFVLDDITPPASVKSIEQRLSQARRLPENRDLTARNQRVILLSGSPEAARTVAVVVHDSAVSYFDPGDGWARELLRREWTLIRDSLTQTTTLANVESFSPAIAATFRAKAVTAVLLSTLLVVIYVWVRFGSFRYSMAAIVTTLHDCLVAVGAIAASQVFYRMAPDLAESLGIMSFKLDLNLVAAVLTILGYSLNDTIIVMDRIRETKGKLVYAPRRVINESINKTVSRTIITSGTTLFAVVVLYIYGGEAVRGFSFAMLVGIFVGTYSSIAVAAPLVWSDHHEPGSGAGPRTEVSLKPGGPEARPALS